MKRVTGKPIKGTHIVSGDLAVIGENGKTYIHRKGVFGLGKGQEVKPQTIIVSK